MCLPSPLLSGAMSSAFGPTCFCVCSVAGSGAQQPGQPQQTGCSPPCAGATWGMGASLGARLILSSTSQAQAGSAAVWSLRRR